MQNSRAEVKLIKDEYAGFYSCGLTMLGSSTMRRFTETEEEGGMLRLRSEDGLELKTETKKSACSDAYEIQTEFVNNSENEITMEMLTSFLFPDIKADRVHRILSFWSAEGRVKTDELADLNMEHAWNDMAFRVEKFGNVGSMPVRRYFPFVALEDSDAHTFFAVQLYAPASWQIELTVRRGDVVTLSGGIADRDFGQWMKTLKPGESFRAPKAVAAVGDSFEDVCDKLVKAQHPDISPVDDQMGIVFNEYCTTWGNPDIDKLKKLADRIAGKGIQYLVMDSGWYSDCGYWWEYRGDWSINGKRFPNGLKELADYIRAKGMIPGIWFEFETVGYKAKQFEDSEHLVKKDGVPLTIGGARFWDMEDPWVGDYLKSSVTDRLKADGFGYIKIDYNDTLGMGCDGEEAPGENLRRKVLATQDYFRTLKREIPELVIENCSSGGHRLEPSFMELASMASFSDAHEIAALPIIAANVQRVIRAEQSQIWSVLRAKDSDSRIFYSMCATFLGRMGLSGDIYELTDHQWELVDDAIAFYKKAAHVIKDGKTSYIGCDAKSYNEPAGSQLVIRELGNERLLVFHRFKGSCSLEEYLAGHVPDHGDYEPSFCYGKAEEDFSAMAVMMRRTGTR
ncbi:MAG: alpha-galactosidase [Lachnospiraceae bacterium]|nr:alpha-galactosidase [Lachnospiraceae bacterium]